MIAHIHPTSSETGYMDIDCIYHESTASYKGTTDRRKQRNTPSHQTQVLHEPVNPAPHTLTPRIYILSELWTQTVSNTPYTKNPQTSRHRQKQVELFLLLKALGLFLKPLFLKPWGEALLSLLS